MKGTGHNTKRFEVLFRHVFTSVYPHEELEADDNINNTAIPISRLSHVTHNSGADMIRKQGFKPSKKLGKAYKWDGHPMGESFRDDFINPSDISVTLQPDEQYYKYIKDRESIMPDGYYSWWGIHMTDEWYQENKMHLRGIYDLPPYLQYPPKSFYGNKEFSGELQSLLGSYKLCRDSIDVYLLVGGTLRYIHEICCVVIVCTDKDRKSDSLKDYEPVSKFPEMPPGANPADYPHPILALNGLTDENGKVMESNDKIPEFYPKHISKQNSWANLSFAFYFKDACQIFKVNCYDERDIDHTTCINKQPPPLHGAKWICPNELF